MDEIINQIAEENQNPSLREDLIKDLWNSEVGKDFESIEALSEALSKGEDPKLIIAARQWLGLLIFE